MAEFRRDYDVVVAGAGVAGVAAAVAAARNGRHTAIIEKSVLTGGLATSGLVYEYTPLCDGRGHQVTFGLAEEMLLLSFRYGPGGVPANWATPDPTDWRCRYSTAFSPASFVLALDELLCDAGVDVWFDTLVSEPVMEGDRVVGLIVENKSGRGLLGVRCVVDATGDADVAFRAGAPCDEQDNWLSLWALGASADAPFPGPHGSSAPGAAEVRLGACNTGAGHPGGVRKYMGTRGRDVSEFVLDSRRLLREYYTEAQSRLGAVGRSRTYPLTLPAMAQFRTTRCIRGQETLTEGMNWQHFEDSVGLVADWARRGDVWEVPYGTLLPRDVTGLVAAGRCISSVGYAWEVTRVIHAAAHTGELAGTAAGLAVERGTAPDALSAADIRARVGPTGVLHDCREVPRETPAEGAFVRPGQH